MEFFFIKNIFLLFKKKLLIISTISQQQQQKEKENIISLSFNLFNQTCLLSNNNGLIRSSLYIYIP